MLPFPRWVERLGTRLELPPIFMRFEGHGIDVYYTSIYSVTLVRAGPGPGF